jgi:hypothetical protein
MLSGKCKAFYLMTVRMYQPYHYFKNLVSFVVLRVLCVPVLRKVKGSVARRTQRVHKEHEETRC